ncbi:MAG: hypothetical protein PF446_06455 [Oleiagrimonas sp.]|jgi:hypothetical protein|nr:hypothetical protein [Oleiagrimonas sp.]
MLALRAESGHVAACGLYVELVTLTRRTPLMLGQRMATIVAGFNKAVSDYKPGSTVMLLVRGQQANTALVTLNVVSLHDR